MNLVSTRRGVSAATSVIVASPIAAAVTATPNRRRFIESWFGQFKKRVAWRAEWETIDQARRDITAYIDIYHHRPHSGLRYRTPAEVAQTWRTLNNSAT